MKMDFKEFVKYYKIYFVDLRKKFDDETIRFWKDKISSMDQERLYAALEELKEKYLFQKSKGNRPSVPNLGDIEFAYSRLADTSKNADYAELERRRKLNAEWEMKENLKAWNNLSEFEQQRRLDIVLSEDCSVFSLSRIKKLEDLTDEYKSLMMNENC